MKISINKNTTALIFDLDGTIVDTMPAHFESWKEAGEIYGFEYPEKLFYEWAGIPAPKLVTMISERYGLSLDPQKVTTDKEAIFVEKLNQVRPIQPVLDIIQQYAGKLPMAVGTGGGKEVALKTLKLLDLTKFFPVIVTADDVTNHKPAPDTFLKCAELLGAEPQNCQVFEDGDTGLQAAHTAGMIATDIRPYV